MDELPDHEHDDFDEDCPLCRGDVSDEFIAKILNAKPLGLSMTVEEAGEWLRSL